jgi:biopolymer transport protein ExbD
MSFIKGSIHRKIKAPGYHIRPKYDLRKLREKLWNHQKKEGEAALPLTAMVDMFSVLIIFLIMNFSATGEIFFISKDLKLPAANHGNALESLPLISITKDAVVLEAEKTGDNPVYLEEKDENLPRLRLKLQQLRILGQTIHPDQAFKGEVNIQADVNTPIVYVKRVMNTLISEGWTGINFAVQGSNSERPQPKDQ